MKEILNKLNTAKLLEDNNFICAYFIKEDDQINIYYKKKPTSITKTSYVLNLIEEKFPKYKINLNDLINMDESQINKIKDRSFYKVGEKNE